MHQVSLSNPLRFGTVLLKKPTKVERLYEKDAYTWVHSLSDGTRYPIPTTQFRQENTLVNGTDNVYISAEGLWRDFKSVRPGTLYIDKDGKRRRCEGSLLAREQHDGTRWYEPSVYNVISSFKPAPNDNESKDFYRQVLNLAQIHGPVTPKQMRDVAKSLFGNRSFVFALAGYTAAGKDYATSSHAVLEALSMSLGVGDLGLVTSPTATKFSIDATGTLFVQKNPQVQLIYVTAENYIPYIKPSEFDKNIDLIKFTATPKYFGKDPDDYSQTTAEASRACLVYGGRNAAVHDAINALKKGNKLVIIRDKALPFTAWNTDKVDNASAYLAEQISAYLRKQPLPYPSRGELSEEVLSKVEETHGSLASLVKVIDVDTRKQRGKRLEECFGPELKYFLLSKNPLCTIA